MFTTTQQAQGALSGQIGSAAYFTVQRSPTERTLYYARRCPENGAIDPTFVLAAYMLQDRPTKGAVTVVPTYRPAGEWVTAFYGIAHLAGEQQVALSLGEQAKDAEGTKEIKAVLEVKLAGSSPASAPLPGVVPDIFAPPPASGDLNPISGRGTHTIPRLYMMTAILLEDARKAAVVALIVDRSGSILSFGIKYPSEGGCAHAELKAVFELKGLLPGNGGALISTLKPCTMCAGLLHGVDPGGKLRKFWGRDDPSFGANWEKGLGFKLPSASQLDHGTTNAKALKVRGPDGTTVTFLEGFQQARAGKPSPADAKAWFADWLKTLKLPDGLHYLVNNAPARGRGPEVAQAIGALKQGITDVNELCTKLGRIPGNPNELKDRTHLGVTNDQRQALGASLEAFKKKKATAVYPERMIDFIASGRDSVALRASTRAVMQNKLRKYGLKEGVAEGVSGKAVNPHVTSVLTYLKAFLATMHVTV